MINLTYCTKCLENLYDSGGVAFIIYEGICENFVKYKIPMPVELLEPGAKQILHYLEMKGYVVTTEIEKDTIAVLPHVHTKPNLQGYFFECKLCNHSQEPLDEI